MVKEKSLIKLMKISKEAGIKKRTNEILKIIRKFSFSSDKEDNILIKRDLEREISKLNNKIFGDKCAMKKGKKCNSDYNKYKCCNIKNCPYKLRGEFAMAINDKKNE